MTRSVRRSFDRRRFLRGLGAASLLVPPLLRTEAAFAAPRKNVVLFFVGGGIEDVNWYQKGRKTGPIDERPFTGALSVFDGKYAALRKKLTVIEGAYGFWTKNGRNEALFSHDRSVQCALTCTHVDDPDTNPSLDRRLAEHLQNTGQKVPFASLMFCVSRSWGPNGRGEVSRGGSAALSTQFVDVIKAYERVFMGVTGGSGPQGLAPETARALERGILSASLEQCALVKKQAEVQLGREAARKINDQCDALRDMEARVMEMSPMAGGCQVPDGITGGTFNKAVNFHQALDAWRAVGANALACGRTNVVLIELWRDQPDFAATFQAPEFQKMLIHLWHFHKNDGRGVDQANRARADLDNRTVEEFAKWGAALEGLQLLDDGLVLWTSNEPRGDHRMNNYLPLMYAGSLGKRLRTGQYVRLAEAMDWNKNTVLPSANEVYTTVLRAAGLDAANHGPTKYHKTGDLIAKALMG